MQDIDFLPAGYRESNARRLHRLWHMMLAGVLLACCAAATTFQLWQSFQILDEIAAVQASYDATVALAARLDQTRARLDAERTEARLITYLAHPWPKSQIVAAILRPLNDAITLEEIRIGREQISGPPGVNRKTPPPALAPAAANDTARKAPAERDLKELQAEFDATRQVVHLSGVTHEGSELYHYIAALIQDPLVETAELSSLESNNKNETQGIKSLSKFQARILIRPGYGQPRGPLPRPASPRDKRIANTRSESRS
jgi:hypothetical protein